MKTLKEVRTNILSEERDETTEKVEMAETQLHFICYAAKEILEYIQMGGEIEEWYQNKLSKVHSDVESLHSYVEGEKRRTGMVDEEVDTGEADARKTAPSSKEKREKVFANFRKRMKELGEETGQAEEEVEQVDEAEVPKMSVTDRMDARDVYDHKKRTARGDKDPPEWKKRMQDRHTKLTKKYGKGYLKLAGISKVPSMFPLTNVDNVHRLVKKHGTENELARTKLVKSRQRQGTDSHRDDEHLHRMVLKYSDIYNEHVEQIDEAASLLDWKKIADNHLRDLNNPHATERQKDYARRHAAKALKASKMRDQERAYRYYMGVLDEEVEQIDEGAIRRGDWVATHNSRKKHRVVKIEKSASGPNILHLHNGSKISADRVKTVDIDYSPLKNEEAKQIDEVKQFRTAYGWAGGRNERTGGVHKMRSEGPNAFQSIASHFKQHLKTNYGLKSAKHENQIGQHMHWIDANGDGPLDHEGIIAAAKELDPNAQASIENRTNKMGWEHGDSEGTHYNTTLTIKGQYKNKPFELTHSNSSWEPGEYARSRGMQPTNSAGQLRLSIHKNELSRAGLDQGLVNRGGPGSPWSTRR